MKKLLGNSGAKPKEGSYARSEDREQGHHGRNHSDLEEKYRTVLGVTDTDSPSTIKEKYRDLIARYHPDKLQHLGEEFQTLAEQKSRAIIEAYEFLRKRYNM
jgi:DnaJ like chaperone protein